MPTDISQGITSGAMTRAEFGEQDSSESYFENNIERIHMRFVNLRVNTKTYTNGSVFILGNNQFGILGSNRLGEDVSSYTGSRHKEQYMWTDYVEEFDNTTYKDSINTTAVGWGSGSVLFQTAVNTINFTSGSYTATVAVSAGSIQLS